MTTSASFATYPSLRGRAVLITGGATGIGASFVEHFAAQGSRVAFLDIDEPAAEKLVSFVAATAAHRPLFRRCDLTHIDELVACIREIESQLGAVSVLVNNAANDDRHSFENVTPAYWDNRMAVNLRHQFFALQAVVPKMRDSGGGSIINMSSIGWMIPSTGQVAYVTAKAAIAGMTRTMAHELGPHNIRVNSVAPGAIATQRQRRLWLTPEYQANILANQSLKRLLAPEDVARLVLFLASDDSSAITNQNYVVDGGWV